MVCYSVYDRVKCQKKIILLFVGLLQFKKYLTMKSNNEGKNVYLTLYSSILTKTLASSVKTKNSQMSYKYILLL